MQTRFREDGTRELLSLDAEDLETINRTGTIAIPQDITALGPDAFESCIFLRRILIPKNLVYFSPNTFAGCNALEEISVEEGNPRYDSRENCNAVILTADNRLVLGCKKTSLPASVASIAMGAFPNFTMFDYQCILYDVEPGNAGYLGEFILPKTVTRVECGAFLGCADLSRIEVEAGHPVYDSRGGCNAIVETATDTLLVGCRETAIPSTVRAIAPLAFSGITTLSSLVLPEGISCIGRGAFEFCHRLTELRFPSGLKSIGPFAFWCCKGLKKAVIPASIEEIGENAFLKCEGATIYCEAPEKPEGWHESWCGAGVKVVWNHGE